MLPSSAEPNIIYGIMRNAILASQYFIMYSFVGRYSYFYHLVVSQFRFTMLFAISFLTHRNAMKLVLFFGHPLQVFKPIVSFHTIDVMDFKRRISIRQEGFCDKTMNGRIPSLAVGLQHSLPIANTSYPRLNDMRWSCSSGAIFPSTSSNISMRTDFIPIIEGSARMLLPYLCHINMLTKTTQQIKT